MMSLPGALLSLGRHRFTKTYAAHYSERSCGDDCYVCRQPKNNHRCHGNNPWAVRERLLWCRTNFPNICLDWRRWLHVPGRLGIENSTDTSSGQKVPSVEDNANAAADVPRIIKTTQRKKTHLLRLQGSTQKSQETTQTPRACIQHENGRKQSKR